VRTLDRQVRQQTIAHIRTLADGIERVTGTKLRLCFEASNRSVYNDEGLTELLGRVAEDVLGPDRVALLPRPSMGSEDFAAYLEHVPGVMFRLGCAGDRRPWPGLHTPTFDVDERCLAVGARLLARYVVEWSRPAKPQA
jgi:amidohydrolase